MSSRLRLALATAAVALTSSANPVVTSAQHKPVTSDQAQIIETVSTIFSAASAEDIAKFDSVIAPDFYIFANGTRFNGDATMGAIKAQHAAGKRYDEHVTDPDIHISGNIAWIAYVNKGSITDASGTVTRTGWNRPSWRNRQAPGGSSSCTARVSLSRLKGTNANEVNAPND